jgi:predicted PurR-regulated permease PerM
MIQRIIGDDARGHAPVAALNRDGNLTAKPSGGNRPYNHRVPNPSLPASNPSKTFSILSFAVVLALLYFAREVLIPFSLAVLLSFLLAPLVARFRRWGLSRFPSIVVTVLVAFALIGVVAYIVSIQVVQLADDLPRYQQNVRTKVRDLRLPGGDALKRTTNMVRGLTHELSGDGSKRPAPDTQKTQDPPPGDPPAEARPPEPRPVPVEVVALPTTPMDVLRNVVASTFGPLTTAAIVVILVIFILAQREDLRDRLIRLVGANRLNLTTQVLDEAGQRVSRYLMMQMIINTAYGVVVGTGLFFIGVPNAILWGLLSTVFRFVPYIGVWIAAAMPLIVAFAVDPGWTMISLSVGLYIVAEITAANFIEPWLYGASAGISSLAVLVAAMVWAWLWGPIGLLLSTPLTVCLVVLGRYIPSLGFLSVLLGDEPVLETHARFYQRMLAMDPDEPEAIAELYLKDHRLEEFYDDVVLPALHVAEHDRHHGLADETRQRFLLDHTRELIEDLASQPEMTSEQAPGKEKQPAPPQATGPTRVVCIPVEDETDELGAAMLAQVLSRHGIAATALRGRSSFEERMSEVAREQASAVCLSILPPYGTSRARQMARDLRSRFPDLKIVFGVWDTHTNVTRMKARLEPYGVESVVSSLGEAIKQLSALVAPAREPEQPVAAAAPGR